MSLPAIPVDRFRPLRGTLGFFRAEQGAQVNIDLPLAPFDSGLPQDIQPVTTAFDLVLYLSVDAIAHLDGREFAPDRDDCQSSIYLGSAHNPVHVSRIRFQRTAERVFHVACELTCDFAFEGVGQPAAITIQVDLDVDFDGSPADVRAWHGFSTRAEQPLPRPASLLHTIPAAIIPWIPKH